MRHGASGTLASGPRASVGDGTIAERADPANTAAGDAEAASTGQGTDTADTAGWTAAKRMAASGAGRQAALDLAFQRLDAMLARALPGARERFGADDDAFRGLYISESQAHATLNGPAGRPLLDGHGGPGAAAVLPDWDEIASAHRGWRWLRESCGLTATELDIVLIGLGPEADLRYERLYGYLQDDVTRRRPTVNLALDLITATADEKLTARGLFLADAPLTAGHVLQLAPDPQATVPPLLAHVIAVDEQIVDVLLLHGGLDRALSGHCRLTTPGPGRWLHAPIPAGERDGLLAAARTAARAARAPRGEQPLRLYIHGHGDAARLEVAEALAGETGAPLLVFDLSGLPADAALGDVLFRVFREARLHGAVLCLDNLDALAGRVAARAALARQLHDHDGVAVLTGTQPWEPLGGAALGVAELSLIRPSFEVRRRSWSDALAAAHVAAPPGLAEVLADRFKCGPGQISDAVATAVSAGRAAGTGITEEALFAAARGQTSHLLTTLASQIEPVYRWDDIVLPADSLAQLRELCQRVTLRQVVWQQWGFDRKVSQGKGTVALFTGPPGTGKTMAAEVIAAELGLGLFKIDLSSMVSKYIGETEKNLERIFAAAAGADAILMFDEADALFGKRSEVRDSHDRYANIEISYLLQRIEQYDGIAILATNLREHLDAAFTRRMQFIIDFPFPDDEVRRQIWESGLPAGVPREPGIDFARLSQFRLSGGNIRNVVLHAAFLAAAADQPVGMAHMLQAVRREHYKMGKVASDAEFGLQEPAAEVQEDSAGTSSR
jgi:ATPase family associated with various cellular activities (AAA)